MSAPTNLCPLRGTVTKTQDVGFAVVHVERVMEGALQNIDQSGRIYGRRERKWSEGGVAFEGTMGEDARLVWNAVKGRVLHGDFDCFILTVKLNIIPLSEAVTSPAVSTSSNLPDGFCSNDCAMTGQSAECKIKTKTIC